MPNFWWTDAACILKIQWFPLSILIFVQKSCFLGPTIFKIPRPSWFNAHGCIFIPLFSAKALHDELLELSGSEDRGLMFCVHNKIPIFSTDDMPYYNIKSLETLQEKRLRRRSSLENSYGNLILSTKTKVQTIWFPSSVPALWRTKEILAFCKVPQCTLIILFHITLWYYFREG